MSASRPGLAPAAAIVAAVAGAVVVGSMCCSPRPKGRDAATAGREDRSAYRSPLDVAFSPNGSVVAVSDHTGAALVLIDASSGRVKNEVKLRGRPSGVAWSDDGKSVYVAERGAGSVAVVDAAGRVTRRLNVGPWPFSVAAVRGRLLVTDFATSAVHVVDTAGGQEKARIGVTREPCCVAVTPDRKLAVVGNRLPAGDASRPSVTADVSLIDLDALTLRATIDLPPNSMNVHGLAVSPDGRWAYVVHNLARAMLPTEQIEYGWINANALSILDLAAARWYATVLLDETVEGLANPWGAAVSPDGSSLWITLSGVHQIARVDLGRLHRELRRVVPQLARFRRPAADGPTHGALIRPALTLGGRAGPGSVEVVYTDRPVEYAQGLYIAEVLARTALGGNGPRGLAISPDGRRLAVAMYYSGEVVLLDPSWPTAQTAVRIPGGKPPDEIRRGEMIFHDATRCYQNWLSCATCHPEGRADGLNWDLLNDGIGNAKNTKSLVWSGVTPPAMSEGVRPHMSAAADAGFRFLLFKPARPDELRAVEAYIRSLRPVASPYLMSAAARRGEALFRNDKTRCDRCHPQPLLTDRKTYDVGTRVDTDRTGRFDTPALVELWRTAPYLHHGRGRTLREVLTKFNRDDRHGGTSHLSARELGDLIEYLKTL